LVGGAIDDFSKSVARIPYVATVELSGTNSDGYVKDGNILSFLFQLFKNFFIYELVEIIPLLFHKLYSQIWVYDAREVY
jgi:hypothetical protein